MAIILKWICTNVELKLKRETLKSQQRKIPELQKKVKEYLSRISDDNTEIQKLQEEITNKKRELDAIKQIDDNLPITNNKSNNMHLDLDLNDSQLP